MTISLTAESESAEFILEDKRTYTWQLPSGMYALMSGDGPGCEGEEPDIMCLSDGTGTLQVSGGPMLTLESLPGGRFVLGLSSADSGEPGDIPMLVSIFDADGAERAVTSDLVFFESDGNVSETLFPMIADSAVLGTEIYEPTPGGMAQTHQPMLHGGDYAGYSSFGEDGARFEVTTGRFYPGDVVEIVPLGKMDKKIEASIWGHILMQPAVDGGVPLLNITLHTSIDRLTVDRFGAASKYKVEVPFYQVISSHPYYVTSWAFFLSLLIVCQAYGGFADRIEHSKPVPRVRPDPRIETPGDAGQHKLQDKKSSQHESIGGQGARNGRDKE